MPLAVVSIPVVTPVSDEPTPESVAQRLRDIAESAPHIALAVEQFAGGGWAMEPPETINDDAYVDIFLAFTREFADEHEAERAARRCLPHNHDRYMNASLGWNARRDHPQGVTHHEAVEWWSEL